MAYAIQQPDRRLLGVIAASLLTGPAGCASFHSKPISLEQTGATFEARTLDAPGLKTFMAAGLGHEVAPWPPASWDVDALTLAAWYYHPDMELAWTGWDAAKAGVRTAGARPNPSVSFVPQYVTNASATELSPWVLGPSADVTMETAGKRRHRMTQAKHLAQAARWQVNAMAWQLRSQVRARLLELYAAGQEAAMLEEQQRAEASYATVMQERFAAGEAGTSAIMQMDIALQRTVLASRDAQQRLADARAQLAETLGLPVSALSRVDLSFDAFRQAPPPIPAQEIRREVLWTRTDLLAALAEYAASEDRLRLEVAKQYPDLHWGPAYSWDQGTDKWSLGISMTLPLLDQNQGPIAEAKAHRAEAATRVTALQAKTIGELDRALAKNQAAREALLPAETLLASQTAQYAAIRRMVQAGGAAPPTLLAAQVELTGAQQLWLRALVEAHRSFGQVEDAMQRPMSSP